MHILSVVWFKVLPPKYGGQKGTALFNRHLSTHVGLTCICSKNNEPGDETGYTVLPSLPNSKLQFFNPFCWFRITLKAKKIKADAIILEYPYHAIAGILAKKLLNITYILHEHNIEFARFKHLGKWWWKLLFYYEQWACQHADLIFFKTKEDVSTAVALFGLNAKKCCVVPYGIEKYKPPKKETIRQQLQLTGSEKIILFAGTLDYKPNAEAVVHIFRKLVPELEKSNELFKILICGRLKKKAFQYLKELKHPHVLFLGEVENIEPYYSISDVFINPVLYTGGVQTKIIEALAFHVAVVAFHPALAGIETALAASKIFAVENEDWQAFACAVQKSFTVKEKIPQPFFDYYNWNRIAAAAWKKLKLFQNPITSR